MRLPLSSALCATLLLVAPAADAAAQHARVPAGRAAAVIPGRAFHPGLEFGTFRAPGAHLYRGRGDAALGAPVPAHWRRAHVGAGRYHYLHDILVPRSHVIVIPVIAGMTYVERTVVHAPLAVAAAAPPAPASGDAGGVQACATITVLHPDNRGFWREVRFPVAGARNRQELERVLAARLEEGVAFRLRDAAGNEVPIPAAGELDRVLVLPCR